MNKVHWNTVQFDGSVPVRLVNDLVDHSYELVVAALPKKLKEELQRLKDEE
jgi:predicted DNA-binding protein (MmcQ/YjbR family)